MNRRTVFLSLIALVALTIFFITVPAPDEATLSSIGETVKRAKPTATRELLPPDLVLAQSNMDLVPLAVSTAGNERRLRMTSRHLIEIRNEGELAYRDVMLEFSYLDRTGKRLGRKRHRVKEPVLPGASIIIRDLILEDLPSRTETISMKILFADLVPPSAQVSTN